MSNQVTQSQVLQALSRVLEPELGKELVSLNMIRDLTIHDGVVRFTIVLTTPACPLKSEIEAAARAAVLELPGVVQVDVKLDASVPMDRRLTGKLDIGVKNAVSIASGK